MGSVATGEQSPGDLLPKRGLLKVTFLFKSLLSERKDDGDVLHTSFAMHKS